MAEPNLRYPYCSDLLEIYSKVDFEVEGEYIPVEINLYKCPKCQRRYVNLNIYPSYTIIEDKENKYININLSDLNSLNNSASKNAAFTETMVETIPYSYAAIMYTDLSNAKPLVSVTMIFPYIP